MNLAAEKAIAAIACNITAEQVNFLHVFSQMKLNVHMTVRLKDLFLVGRKENEKFLLLFFIITVS
jgi:hypothetical protein